ncbi:hypothetical protein Q9295_09750 [Xinfangfangia sp. CPCC 101601]|uniref:Uncharacterized protein n=1 Tax=Pseudogemmobacter lacusdianii TaxID=3069608 RepID=A0ABU0VY67_9RHOB|nr:hypothetical protein [Xinfangfangia sp. CPCC 101601]MDQ2066659.1 hypothetical protein [Xinfangfangia sp. CPCC 101601]
MALKPGDTNVFGMQITALNGRMVDLECPTCRSRGAVAADEFQSTRCGSSACAASQGRTE